MTPTLTIVHSFRVVHRDPEPGRDPDRHQVSPRRSIAALGDTTGRMAAGLRRRVSSGLGRHDPAPVVVPLHRSPGFTVVVDTTQRVLVLAGEMDLAALDSFALAAASLTVGRRGGVTIDLCDLRYIDAAGLGAIVALNNVLRRGGQDLTLRHVHPRVRRVFVLGGLSDLLATAR